LTGNRQHGNIPDDTQESVKSRQPICQCCKIWRDALQRHPLAVSSDGTVCETAE